MKRFHSVNVVWLHTVAAPFIHSIDSNIVRVALYPDYTLSYFNLSLVFNLRLITSHNDTHVLQPD